MINHIKTKIQAFYSLLFLLLFFAIQSCNQAASSTEKEQLSDPNPKTDVPVAEEKTDKYDAKVYLSVENKLDAVLQYCDYLNEMKYEEIEGLFAPQVEQFILAKDLSNKEVAKMAKEFLIQKKYVDYSAHIDELERTENSVRLPIEIRWKGYHAKVLTAFQFNQDYKITSLKEVEILEKRKIEPKIKTRSEDIAIVYDNCKSKEDLYNCTYYQVEYELLTATPNPKLKDHVNALILASEENKSGEEAVFRKEHQQAGEALMEDFKSFEADGRTWHQNYSDHFEEIGDILTLVSSYSEYMGGAHGMGFTTTTHFDMNSGEHITIDDIFVEGYEVEIRKIIKRQMDEMDYDFPDMQPLPENFHFGMRRLIFYYNQYELGIYLPAPGFQLKYQDIKHLMKNDSPVYSILES